ncbi:hypothetical protein Tco_1007714 [Tanacetum coccineum]
MARKCSFTCLLERCRRSSKSLVQNDSRNHEKIVQIQAEIASCSVMTKGYADLKRKPMEFQVGDKVMLKSFTWKGQSYVLQIGVSLNPDMSDLSRVIGKVGTPVHTSLVLSQDLSRVYNTFHVSNLKRCYSDDPLTVPLDGLHIDDQLHFVEEPVEIVDHEVKRLK